MARVRPRGMSLDDAKEEWSQVNRTSKVGRTQVPSRKGPRIPVRPRLSTPGLGSTPCTVPASVRAGHGRLRRAEPG